MTSFEQAMESAEKVFQKKVQSNGATYIGGKGNKTTIGFRKEVCEYAQKHSATQASDTFGVPLGSVYNWVGNYRAGKYDNIPGDYRVARPTKDKPSAAQEKEIARLTKQNQDLIATLNKLIERIR